MIESANHFPALPATGCQPISTVRGSPLIEASPFGTTLGLWPRPTVFCRLFFASAISDLPTLRPDWMPSLLQQLSASGISVDECETQKATHKNVVTLLVTDGLLSVAPGSGLSANAGSSAASSTPRSWIFFLNLFIPDSNQTA